MGRVAKNEIGNTYGSLFVVSRATNGIRGEARWNCICVCGNEVIVPGYCLRRIDTRSCGCRRKETITGYGGRFVDKTGKRYGKLTVTKLHHIDKGGYSNWVCQCDCGNTKILPSSQLWKKGVTSCGCRARLPKGEGAFNQVFGHYRRQAKKRGVDWNLDKDEFRKITKRDCFYCGKPPSQKGGGNKNNGFYIYNGVDRIDSQKGYDLENAVSCCGECNRAKNNMSIENFRNMIESIFVHWASRTNSRN